MKQVYNKQIRNIVAMLAMVFAIFSTVSVAQETVYEFDFDHLSTGEYNEVELEEALVDINFCNGADEGRVHISNASGHGKVLDVKFPEGGVKTSGSGLNTKWYFNDDGDYEELYYSYSLYIPSDFEWATGGKLPGLGYQTSERNMSLRLMWREEGLLEFYVHYNTEPSDPNYQASINWSLTNPYDYDGGPGDDQVKLKKGEWNHIKMYFKLNTPGQPDGIMRGWLNDELAIDVTDNADMRTSSEGDIRLNCMYFSAFFGTSVPSPVNTYCYFDDLLVTKDGTSDVVPVTGVSMSQTSVTLADGATVDLNATVTPSTATNKSVSWTSSNTSVATVNSSGLVTAVNAGSATIKVTTADGNKTATCAVTVTSIPEQSAYPSGVPHAIPGIIASINYDNGGEGIAYHDASSGNTGSGPRQDEDVDLGTNNIGWIAIGEWVEYTVDVEAGIYDIEVEVASATAYGKFHIEFNGADKTGVQTVNNTGGWGTYYTITISDVSLSGGEQIMRVYMDGKSFNLKDLTFTKQGNTIVPVTDVSLSPSAVSLLIGETSALSATISPSNATNKTVTYSSSNTSVATVNSSGLVSAVSVGSATITVTTNDGSKTDNCLVTVSTSDGGSGGCGFEPMTTALPSINTSYENIFVSDNGPDLSNIRKFSINWSLGNNGLYTFAFNTTNNVPSWYVDMKSAVTKSLNSAQPSITVSGSGISGFDGDYYAIMDGSNFVLAEKNGSYSIYFSTSSTAPDCDGLKAAEGVESELNSISVYPNPISQPYLYITGLTDNNVQVIVTDMLGKTVIMENVNNELNGIDVSTLKAGAYILIIKGENTQTSKLFNKL